MLRYFRPMYDVHAARRRAHIRPFEEVTGAREDGRAGLCSILFCIRAATHFLFAQVGNICRMNREHLKNIGKATRPDISAGHARKGEIEFLVGKFERK